MTRAEAAAGLDRFNALPAGDAERALLTCCAAPAWAAQVAARRPYADVAALRQAAERAYAELTWPDIETAMSAHPRIGERRDGADREAAWSRAEQSGTRHADAHVREELRAGNLAYEERFGHVFLICATGLSADAMLAALRERLAADVETERRTVRAELLKITQLRLTKLLETR
jgi:2-oxo-4-hydroxy-4-carboxy-5-ureidoimidazoline decarboxylase